MVDYTLKPSTALNGLSRKDESFQIEEVSGEFIHSIACFDGNVENLRKYFKSNDFDLPEAGQVSSSKEESLFSSGRDQWFLRSAQENAETLEKVAQEFGDQIAITDQSDAWVQVRLSGSAVRDKLERLCALDLHPSKFSVGTVGRTMMEHLNVIIIHESQDVFLLMSARSSARSFSHMFS